jgi:hypothetical protein
MHYELWDTETRNLIEDFDEEVSALVAAAELIDANRGHYPEHLALARVDATGTSWLASGTELGVRVERHREQRGSLTG